MSSVIDTSEFAIPRCWNQPKRFLLVVFCNPGGSAYRTTSLALGCLLRSQVFQGLAQAGHETAGGRFSDLRDPQKDSYDWVL